MKLNRRDLLTQAGLFAASAKLAPAAARDKNVSGVLTRADFPIAETQTYLNSAGWHPMPAVWVIRVHAVVGPRTRATISASRRIHSPRGTTPGPRRGASARNITFPAWLWLMM